MRPRGSAGMMPSDNCYATADGDISVVALTRPQIAALHDALGLSGSPTADDMAKVFRTASSAEWQARLNDVGVPTAIVRDLPAALADPQIAGRDILRTAPAFGNEPEGRVTVAGPAFSVSPPAPDAAAAPVLGEHTTEVLHGAGFSDEQIEGWRAAGIV